MEALGLVAQVREAADREGLSLWLSDAELYRVILSKKHVLAAVATARRYQELHELMSPHVSVLSKLSQALGSGWLWLMVAEVPEQLRTPMGKSKPHVVVSPPADTTTFYMLCVKVSRLTSDHTPTDIATGLYFTLEWLSRIHKESVCRQGISVMVNMEDAGMQVVDKLVRQQTLKKLQAVFAQDCYPIRVNHIRVFNCSSMSKLAVLAAKSYLPTNKLKDRITFHRNSVATDKTSLGFQYRTFIQDAAFEEWWHEAVLPRMMAHESRGGFLNSTPTPLHPPLPQGRDLHDTSHKDKGTTDGCPSCSPLQHPHRIDFSSPTSVVGSPELDQSSHRHQGLCALSPNVPIQAQQLVSQLACCSPNPNPAPTVTARAGKEEQTPNPPREAGTDSDNDAGELMRTKSPSVTGGALSSPYTPTVDADDDDFLDQLVFKALVKEELAKTTGRHQEEEKQLPNGSQTQRLPETPENFLDRLAKRQQIVARLRHKYGGAAAAASPLHDASFKGSQQERIYAMEEAILEEERALAQERGVEVPVHVQQEE